MDELVSIVQACTRLAFSELFDKRIAVYWKNIHRPITSW